MCVLLHVCVWLQGEPFSKVKDRLLKKLGIQEKEFEKVCIWNCKLKCVILTVFTVHCVQLKWAVTGFVETHMLVGVTRILIAVCCTLYILWCLYSLARQLNCFFVVQADQFTYMSLSSAVLRSRNCTTLKKCSVLVWASCDWILLIVICRCVFLYIVTKY